MKESRGEFRGIRVCIIDGKDYQQLNPPSKLVFLTLKLRCGQAGICVIPALMRSLSEQTGLPEGFVGEAVGELVDRGWIKTERNVVWIVDGLKHEPGYTPLNPKHQIHMRRYLDSLPHLQILEDFRKYYAYLPGLSPASKGGSNPAAAPVAKRDDWERWVKANLGDTGKRRKKKVAGPLAEEKPPAKEPEPKQETWVQEGCAWWNETVGKLSHGHFGRALKELVEAHGWDKVKLALMRYTVEQQAAEKPVRIDWFAAEGVARITRQAVQRPQNRLKPWEQDEHDAGLARAPHVHDRVKAYKKSLNGEGELWWSKIVTEAKSLHRHPIALAFERLPSRPEEQSQTA